MSDKKKQKSDFDEMYVEEKARLIVENLYMYKHDKKPHYIPTASERKHWNIKMKIAREIVTQIIGEVKGVKSKK